MYSNLGRYSVMQARHGVTAFIVNAGWLPKRLSVTEFGHAVLRCLSSIHRADVDIVCGDLAHYPRTRARSSMVFFVA